MPNLLFNIAALTGQILVLVTLYGLIDAHLPTTLRPRHNLAAKAILFSLVGIYSLYAPIELMDGVIADPRGALLACATLFGGRLVGLVTGLAMIGFRLFLGGAGAWAGAIGLAVEYGCLLLLLQPALARWLPRQSYRLLLAATLAMSLLEPLSLLLIPPLELGWQLLAEAGPALGLLQFFATLLLGALLRIQHDRTRLIAELRVHQIAYDHAQEAVMITDAGGQLRTVNQAFTTITGFAPDEILGQPFTALSDADQPTPDPWETMVSQGGWQGEAWHRRRTGERYPVWLSLSAVRDANGHLTHCVGVFFDITARRNLEDEIKALNTDLELRVKERTAEAEAAKQAAEAAKRTAETANAAKSQFIANMSHEVRTPMNAVLGFLDLLLDTRLDAEQRDMVRKVRSAGQALLRILNDILDVCRLDAGKVTLESAPFRLDEVLYQVADLFTIVAHEKGLQLLIEAPPEIAGGYRGDALRLSQILNNLVGNAIKFSDRGRVTITVMALDEPAQPVGQSSRRRLGFAVRDQGIGLSAEQAARLFQPFSQADETTTRRFGGSGLGLAISKQLVKLMGGEIGVDSSEGEGSTFWFTLTLDLADPNEALAAPALANISPDERVAPVRGAELLLVEDNPTNQEVALAILRKMGLRVEVANHGREALECLQAQRFDLVLMDLHMPVMDGLEATAAIRATDWGRDLPIIAMTAAAFASDRQRVLDVGMNGFLSKPVDPRQLAEVLLCWLPKRVRAGQALAGPGAAVPTAMPIPPRAAVPALIPSAAPNPARGAPPAAAPAAAPPAPPAPPADVLHITDFDLDATRNLIGDDPDLLVSILRLFQRDLADWPARFDRARVAAEPQEALRLAHTLKGAAANVGAPRVRATATALEAALKAAATPERVDALRAECLDALLAAQAALQAALPAPPPAAASAGIPIDLAAARAELAVLEPLLRGQRLVTSARLRPLSESLGGHPAAALCDTLVAQVNAFDFRQALVTLAQLQENLQ